MSDSKRLENSKITIFKIGWAGIQLCLDNEKNICIEKDDISELIEWLEEINEAPSLKTLKTLSIIKLQKTIEEYSEEHLKQKEQIKELEKLNEKLTTDKEALLSTIEQFTAKPDVLVNMTSTPWKIIEKDTEPVVELPIELPEMVIGSYNVLTPEDWDNSPQKKYIATFHDLTNEQMEYLHKIIRKP